MAKPLSAQLADLSVRAKNAEDAIAVAQKEAHDKVVARRDQAHAAASAAIQKVDQDIKPASDNVVANWNALKAKVAERLEWEASFAINYAVAAIEEAKSAALDAIVGRVEAEKAKLS